MYILVDAGFVILATLIFLLMHFILERILLMKAFVHLNLTGYNLIALMGIYYGGISLVTELILRSMGSDSVAIWAVFSSIILVAIRNWLTSLINLIPSMIFVLFTTEIDLKTYLFFGATLMTIVAYVLISDFISHKWERWALLLISCIIFVIATIVYGAEKSFAINRSFFESTFLVPVLLVFPLGITSYVLNFSISANILYDSITYTFSKYFRYEVGKVKIQKTITTSKIKFGIYILFKFDFEKSSDETLNIEIMHSLLENVIRNAPANALFINMSTEINGMFIPLTEKVDIKKLLEGNAKANRDNDDALKVFEMTMEKVQGTYHTSKNTYVPVRVKAGASVYGIQDSSLNKLEDNAYFALNSFTINKNIVQLFDHKRLQILKREAEEVAQMDSALLLDNFEVSFLPIYNLARGKTNFILSKIGDISEFNWQQSTRANVTFSNWLKPFDRYFAVEALKKYATNPLEKIVFHFSPFYMEQLNFEEIIAKVKKTKLQPSQLIFAVDDFKDLTFIKINIEAAKAAGFGVAFINPTKQALAFEPLVSLFIYTPKHFNGEIINIPGKVAFVNVDTIEQLKAAIAKKVNLIAGRLLQEDLEPKVLSEQAISYLNDVMQQEHV